MTTNTISEGRVPGREQSHIESGATPGTDSPLAPLVVLGGRPLSLRGRSFVVKVVSSRLPKTATVEREYRHYLPKYERYTQRRKKLCVHNPPEINAKEGDRVRIVECRPISKTKRFVIVEKLNHESNQE